MELDLAAVQTLLDREAIRDVSLRYTRGIDRHDTEVLASTYHPGAQDDHGDYIGTGAGFVEYANWIHTQNWVSHQHYVTNQFIDLAGDTAHCESYFMAVLKRPDVICDMVGGRYLDRIDRRDGVWAVADRICMVEWTVVASRGVPKWIRQPSWPAPGTSRTRPICVHCRSNAHHATPGTGDRALTQARTPPNFFWDRKDDRNRPVHAGCYWR